MSTRSSSRTLSPRAAGVLLILFAVVAGLAWFLQGHSSSGTNQSASGTSTTGTSSPGADVGGADLREPAKSAPLEAKAQYVLAVVRATGEQPAGYVGGRRFLNDGRGGTDVLPRTDANGNRLTYREYDVNPYVKGVNRGPQRLVIGSDGSAYMTADHYNTWKPVP